MQRRNKRREARVKSAKETHHPNTSKVKESRKEARRKKSRDLTPFGWWWWHANDGLNCLSSFSSPIGPLMQQKALIGCFGCLLT